MYWIIASFIMFAVFCVWSRIEVSRHMRKEKETEANFWQRELDANSVRRKPIDHLDYIKIPENLPVDLLSGNAEIADIIGLMDRLRGEKILNLTGYTNTDLKLEYGAANITELSRYDENYTLMVTSLQKWADILLENGYENEAISIMEFLIETKADIGRTYKLLARYYKENSKFSEYSHLVDTASKLKSLNSIHIIDWLKEYNI